MPFFIIVFLIQLSLVVHVFKTGRNTTWAFILLCFPLIGGLAYLIVELVPDWMNSRTAQKVKSNLSHTINPHKAFKEAYQNAERSDSVDNLVKLAEQCLIKQRYHEAKQLYQRCLTGIFTDDPLLMLGLAQAEFGLQEYDQTLSTLDQLKKNNPAFKSSEGHLLYANAQNQAGNVAAAIHEYQALIQYYPGPEPACRLGLLFKTQGDYQQAKTQFSNVIQKSKVAGKHYNSIHKKWITVAKQEMANG